MNNAIWRELDNDDSVADIVTSLIGDGHGMVTVNDEDVAEELSEIIASTGRKVAVVWSYPRPYTVAWA